MHRGLLRYPSAGCLVLIAVIAASGSAQTAAHTPLVDALQQALLEQRRAWQAAEAADHGEFKGAVGLVAQRNYTSWIFNQGV